MSDTGPAMSQDAEKNNWCILSFLLLLLTRRLQFRHLHVCVSPVFPLHVLPVSSPFPLVFVPAPPRVWCFFCCGRGGGEMHQLFPQC